MIKPNKKFAESLAKQDKNHIIMGLMLVCMLAVVASIIISKQLINNIGFNSRVLGLKRTANKTLESNIKLIPQLQKNFEDLENAGPTPESILSALPTTVDYSGLASSLELIANSSGVKLQLVALTPALTTLPSVPSGDPVVPIKSVPTLPKAVPVTISAQGDYAGILTFLQNMENSQRPIRIDDLKISGDSTLVKIDLTVTTYYQELTPIKLEKEKIQ